MGHGEFSDFEPFVGLCTTRNDHVAKSLVNRCASIVSGIEQAKAVSSLANGWKARAGRLLKQLRLDRLSDDCQLQHRFAADEALLD